MEKELIDFLTELSNEKTLFYIHPKYKRKATELLKSINSAPCERKADSNNEKDENLCVKYSHCSNFIKNRDLCISELPLKCYTHK